MKLQVGVKAIAKNKEGKYLLLRRSLAKYPEMAGKEWDIVGGRINPGETLIENLRREIKEEIELKLETKPQLIGAQDILHTPGHTVRLTYIVELDGNPRLNSHEHTECKWVTSEEFKNMKGLDPCIKELIDQGALEKYFIK